MESFLQRYERGETVGVWRELVALGEQVREEPIRSDALAVARETMRRVLHNLELLIPRLVHVGYQFGYGWIQPPATRPFGWELRRWYAKMCQWAAAEPPILSVSVDSEQWIADYERRLAGLRTLGAPPSLVEPSERRLRELQALTPPAAYVDELESAVGPVPLSVRAFYEVVGGVNLVGTHPGWLRLMGITMGDEDHYDEDGAVHPFARLEPLHVYPLDEARWQRLRSRLEQSSPDSLRALPLMPNGDRAYGQVGQDAFDYAVAIPQVAADAIVQGKPAGTMFVDYLRTCLGGAGFGGWDRVESLPTQELAFLTENMMPF